MEKLVINGQFFIQENTGQQRYAKSILAELDKIINKDEITIIIPRRAINIPDYKNIKIIKTGNINNKIWEQVHLAFYLFRNKKISINLCNTNIFLKPGITVIHDISPITNKQFFNTFTGKMGRLYYCINQLYTIYRAKQIITVSEFSKMDIIHRFHINTDRITVIPNAWQHFKKIVPDDSIFNRYSDICKGKYFFSLGSRLKQKNMEWIYNNAIYNPNEKYVIAGKAVKNYKCKIKPPSNVYILGYISDSEIKSLMIHCRAFIFPSLFEGFGIPPLEALSVGSSIIISDVTCLPEIYEDSASYIDPCNPYINISEKIKVIPESVRLRILEKYSWKNSASIFYDVLKKYEVSY